MDYLYVWTSGGRCDAQSCGTEAEAIKRHFFTESLICGRTRTLTVSVSLPDVEEQRQSNQQQSQTRQKHEERDAVTWTTDDDTSETRPFHHRETSLSVSDDCYEL